MIFFGLKVEDVVIRIGYKIIIVSMVKNKYVKNCVKNFVVCWFFIKFFIYIIFLFLKVFVFLKVIIEIVIMIMEIRSVIVVVIVYCGEVFVVNL